MSSVNITFNIASVSNPTATLTLKKCDGSLFVEDGLENPQIFTGITVGQQILQFDIPNVEETVYEDVYFSLSLDGEEYKFACQNLVISCSVDPCDGVTENWQDVSFECQKNNGVNTGFKIVTQKNLNFECTGGAETRVITVEDNTACVPGVTCTDGEIVSQRVINETFCPEPNESTRATYQIEYTKKRANCTTYTEVSSVITESNCAGGCNEGELVSQEIVEETFCPNSVNRASYKIRRTKRRADCTTYTEDSALIVENSCIDPCTVTPTWALTDQKRCVGADTEVLLEVTGNQGYIVQFSSDTVNWYDANVNTQGEKVNAYWITLPSTGNCEPVYFRVKGCAGSTYGCWTTFPASQCSDEAPCLDGCEQYSVTNTTAETRMVTYEDCVDEDYQIFLNPGESGTMCRMADGRVLIQTIAGNEVSDLTYSNIGNCEECIPYVNSLGGFPDITHVQNRHTRKFDPVFDPVNKTVTDASSYEASNKRYKIDEGPWFQGLVNFSLAGLEGKIVSVSVKYSESDDSAANVAYINMM